jgi:hypothetical protein
MVRIASLRHAVEISRRFQVSMVRPFLRYILRGSHGWSKRSSQIHEQQFKAMQAYNLAKFDDDFDVLDGDQSAAARMARHRLQAGDECRLRASKASSRRAPDMVNVRFLVTSSTLWELKTQQPPHGQKKSKVESP